MYDKFCDLSQIIILPHLCDVIGITAYPPNGVGAIHITSVQCSGEELQLFDCEYDLTDTTTNFYCSSDAGVTCTGMQFSHSTVVLCI